MGRKPTSGGVRPKGDRIEVRFMWEGKQVGPTLDLKPNAQNLRHAARLRETIVREIEAGTFRFAEHFPNYRNREKLQSTKEPAQLTFSDWAATWERLSARSLEHSTLAVYKRHLNAYWIPPFGALLPAQVTHQMVLERLAELASERLDEQTGKVLKPIGRKTQNNILIPLRNVFDLISRSPGAGPNPCDGIENMKVQAAGPDPFTAEEVELALAEIRERLGDAWADYFEFAAYAGLRTGEQIALRWDDVDLRTHTVMVRRAKVMTKEKDRTKTAVERAVELNARAAAVIERQRARTQTMWAQVFWNPTTGKPWHDDQGQRKEWATTLRHCKIRHRPPKELRDSSVTFALMAGADPWYVARQHGHSLTVMMKDYAKWIPSADRGRNRRAINDAIRHDDPGRKEAV